MFLKIVVRKSLWLKSCEEIFLKINYFMDVYQGLFEIKIS